eukprot:3489669-Pyramimonas_sp.AAC.1
MQCHPADNRSSSWMGRCFLFCIRHSVAPVPGPVQHGCGLEVQFGPLHKPNLWLMGTPWGSLQGR